MLASVRIQRIRAGGAGGYRHCTVPSPPKNELRFSVVKAVGSRFSATRVDDPFTSSLGRSVDFAYSKDRITVYNEKDEMLFAATLTLNNKGKCRLVVNNKELTQWEFRRMALEKLFFGPFS